MITNFDFNLKFGKTLQKILYCEVVRVAIQLRHILLL